MQTVFLSILSAHTHTRTHTHMHTHMHTQKYKVQSHAHKGNIIKCISSQMIIFGGAQVIGAEGE